MYPQDGRYSATGSGVIAERITAIRKSKLGRHPKMAKVMSVVPCGGDIAWALLRNVSSECLSYPGDYRTGMGGLGQHPRKSVWHSVVALWAATRDCSPL